MVSIEEAEDQITEERVAALRPKIGFPVPSCHMPTGRALVVGIYLAARPTNVEDIHARILETRCWEVDERWVALGGAPLSDELRRVTSLEARGDLGKFGLLNEVLAEVALDDYEYVLVIDDDIVVPQGFIDGLLALQRFLRFGLAQPARTSNSYIDHPIVEQQRGALARQTRFVEIGPAFSVDRTAFDLVFPFDMTSPMGWGYENVWAYEAERRGYKIGIIDAVPIDHSLRKPVTHYSWHEADTQRSHFLARNPHLPIDQCWRVLDLVPLDAEWPHE
jgi:hypothetical protein